MSASRLSRLLCVAALAGLTGSACAESRATDRPVPRGRHVAIQTLLSTMRAKHVLSVKLDRGHSWLTLIGSRTDSASSTEGKWKALVAGSAFARTMPVNGMTVVTRRLSRGEDGRLTVRFGPAGVRRPPLTSSMLRSRAHRLGIRIDRVSRLGLNAVELRGTVRRPAQYLRVLAGLPSLTGGRNAYFELRAPQGPVVMRVGYVSGVAARGGVVGWVSPSLLRQR